MARDVQIHSPASGATPLQYEVPNAQEIIALCLNATFDGSGAAGSFRPAVRIISDGGIDVGVVPTGDTVAAGGSASVTFAPFLRDEAAASSGTLGVWAGLYIDLSGAPLTVPPVPATGSQAGVFNDLDAPCYFRTNDSTFFSLFEANRLLGDVSLVCHKGDNAWAFYAESGVKFTPAGGGGFAGVDVVALYEGIEVFMQYSGPDVSVNPASHTEERTAPQEMRFVWDNGIPGIEFMWATRSSMWIDDNSAAGDDWTFTMDFINSNHLNPSLSVYEAYLHVFAVPVTAGIITTTLPAIP